MFRCRRGCDVDRFLVPASCLAYGFAPGDGPEMGVYVWADGIPSNIWEDGTVGVSNELAAYAEEHAGDCNPVCPECGGKAEWIAG